MVAQNKRKEFEIPNFSSFFIGLPKCFQDVKGWNGGNLFRFVATVYQTSASAKNDSGNIPMKYILG